jgi:hypothetical protein
MRIISKFSDYYDSAMGMGVDMSRVFVRNKSYLYEERLFRGKDNKDSEWRRFAPKINNYNPRVKTRSGLENVYISPFSVVFCGKAYAGLLLEYSRDGYRDVSECMYDIDSVRKVYKKHGIKLLAKPKRSYFDWNKKPNNEKDLIDYFSIDESHQDFLISKKISIGVYTTNGNGGEFVENPRLKDFGFQKVFDPYQAFQELDMFVSGVLPDIDNAMANISDCDMAKAKGFDCYSFKNRPTKHKRKSCK